MFTRVDISVVPWQRRRDKSIFNILSLFSPTFLPRIHFEDLWLETEIWICTLHGQLRQKKTKGDKKEKEPVSLRGSQRRPATPRRGRGAHSPATPFIKLDIERGRVPRRREEEEK